MAQIDQSDIDNITQLVEAYDRSGGFKFSWKRICAYIKDVQNSLHNKQSTPLCDGCKLVKLLLDQRWHSECEIIPDYMPPYPRENTRPKVVVMFPNEHDNYFLRYSCGPAQGFFWDTYGDDMQSVELAVLALSRAPIPLNYRKLVPFRCKELGTTPNTGKIAACVDKFSLTVKVPFDTQQISDFLTELRQLSACTEL